MLCARCGSDADPDGCSACGGSPLLEGRFALDEVLGEGRESRTYGGHDLETDQRIVAKELGLGVVEDWRRIERFRKEAQVLRELHHPDVPALVGEFETGEGKHRAAWLVVERVAGEDLEAVMKKHRFDEAEVWTLVRRVGSALAWLHERRPPVVHRDLKPKNLIQRPDGGVSIVDFGAVRDTVDDPEVGGSTVTGTFGYMAPEQLRGDALPASDVYALGATALRLLTRERPEAFVGFDGKLKTDRLGFLSPESRRRLQRMMAADPSDRPRDGQALLRFLEREAASPIPEERSSSTGGSLVRSSGRPRGLRSMNKAPFPARYFAVGGPPAQEKRAHAAAGGVFGALGFGMVVLGFAFGAGKLVGGLGIVFLVLSSSAGGGCEPRRRRRLSESDRMALPRGH